MAEQEGANPTAGQKNNGDSKTKRKPEQAQATQKQQPEAQRACCCSCQAVLSPASDPRGRLRRACTASRSHSLRTPPPARAPSPDGYSGSRGGSRRTILSYDSSYKRMDRKCAAINQAFYYLVRENGPIVDTPIDIMLKASCLCCAYHVPNIRDAPVVDWAGADTAHHVA